MDAVVRFVPGHEPLRAIHRHPAEPGKGCHPVDIVAHRALHPAQPVHQRIRRDIQQSPFPRPHAPDRLIQHRPPAGVAVAGDIFGQGDERPGQQHGRLVLRQRRAEQPGRVALGPANRGGGDARADQAPHRVAEPIEIIRPGKRSGVDHVNRLSWAAGRTSRDRKSALSARPVGR